MGTPFPRRHCDDFWRALLELGELRAYEAGMVLFRSGAAAAGIYLIQKGEVSLKLTSSRRKKNLKLETAGPGTILGLGQTLSEDCHKFTAETATDAQICFVDRRQFLEFLRAKPFACMQVVQALSEDLHRLYHTLRHNA